jgi:hypothetical protein
MTDPIPSPRHNNSPSAHLPSQSALPSLTAFPPGTAPFPLLEVSTSFTGRLSCLVPISHRPVLLSISTPSLSYPFLDIILHLTVFHRYVVSFYFQSLLTLLFFSMSSLVTLYTYVHVHTTSALNDCERALRLEHEHHFPDLELKVEFQGTARTFFHSHHGKSLSVDFRNWGNIWTGLIGDNLTLDPTPFPPLPQRPLCTHPKSL